MEFVPLIADFTHPATYFASKPENHPQNPISRRPMLERPTRRNARTPQQKRQDKVRRDAHRARAREAKAAAKSGERKKVDGRPDVLRTYPFDLYDSEVRDLTRLADEADDSGSDPILLGYEWKRWVGQQARKIFMDAFQGSRPKRR
jgi:hypothetical protein